MFFVPNNVVAINFGLYKKIDLQCVVFSVAIWAAVLGSRKYILPRHGIVSAQLLNWWPCFQVTRSTYFQGMGNMYSL